MRLKLWQVDAFAGRVFEGNPAAVVPLESWIADSRLIEIASENNLAETAFLVAMGPGAYELRWFTPTVEVPLCGHATLASAFVVFTDLDPSRELVKFSTKSGVLTVTRGTNGRNAMSFPSGPTEPYAAPEGFSRAIGEALGVAPPDELLMAPRGGGGMPAPLGVWPEKAIRAMRPGTIAEVLARYGQQALLATSKGDGAPYDFVSRFFAPGHGVLEDPVTGSMHCTLTPFWAKRLGKKTMRAFQASPRGGDILCTDEDARVTLAGTCALYLRGEIEV